MYRKLSILVVVTAICAAGLSPASAQDTKKAASSEIPGGVVGKITKVDAEKDTVTIQTEDGKTQTYTIDEETQILGPRGGRVRGRLKNARFHEGMELTVVASGKTVKELHLGYNRQPGDGPAATPKAALKKRANRRLREEMESEEIKTAKTAPAKTESAPDMKKPAATAAATEEDDEDEYPGKIKTFTSNGNRHQLVVALLNGKNGSYMLARDVKVFVKGKPSTKGLDDPAFKEGTPITVYTEAGGRRVKELHILEPPAAPAKGQTTVKKAG